MAAPQTQNLQNIQEITQNLRAIFSKFEEIIYTLSEETVVYKKEMIGKLMIGYVEYEIEAEPIVNTKYNINGNETTIHFKYTDMNLIIQQESKKIRIIVQRGENKEVIGEFVGGVHIETTMGHCKITFYPEYPELPPEYLE